MRYLIGVDPGVKTGFAIWDTKDKQFIEISTLRVWEFFEAISDIHHEFDQTDYKIVIEDARMRGVHASRAQGAGWVKVLSGQYEEYCRSLGFAVEMRRPHRTSKMSAETFKNITKYKQRTSNHARDAAMLVFGFIQ